MRADECHVVYHSIQRGPSYYIGLLYYIIVHCMTTLYIEEYRKQNRYETLFLLHNFKLLQGWILTRSHSIIIVSSVKVQSPDGHWYTTEHTEKVSSLCQ